jgi:hypothetical protein
MMKFALTLICFLIVLVSADIKRPDTDDGSKDFTQLCEKYGFQSEKHIVTTSDGYILQVWRIRGLAGETYKKKATVFM